MEFEMVCTPQGLLGHSLFMIVAGLTVVGTPIPIVIWAGYYTILSFVFGWATGQISC